VVRPLPPPIVRVPRTSQTHLPPKPEPTSSRERGGLVDAVIVIDPGHGGKDPGAPARSPGQWAEKHIVLDIGLKLEGLLTRRGAKVVMTRSSDRFIPLEQRAAIAEQTHADLFVSIHADSSVNSSASGVGVHIFERASAESQRAALRMVAALKRAGIACRGIFRNNFHVLREHSRPAMLIECGFLTNPSDARALNNDDYRARLAEAIADGIASYFER